MSSNGRKETLEVYIGAMVKPETRDGLKRLATVNDRSVSAEIRLALAEHLRTAA
jgi:hypothetical protein